MVFSSIILVLLISISNINGYIIGPNVTDWANAEAYCVSQGSHLATISNSADRDAAKALCIANDDNSGSGCWIGLMADANDVWSWADGSALGYGFNGATPTHSQDPWYPFEPNNPNEDCIHLNRPQKYKWNDAYCNVNNFPLCNDPSCSWCNPPDISNCITDKKGWKLVRAVGPPRVNLFPNTDSLMGTDPYSDDGVAVFNIGTFEYYVPGFNQFLFATGDCEVWLITSRDAIGYPYNSDSYSNSPRNVCLSSENPIRPTTPRWYNRHGYGEDPWISTTDHFPAITDGKIVYGEANFGNSHAANSIVPHDGIYVYARNAGPLDERGCTDAPTGAINNDITMGTNVQGECLGCQKNLNSGRFIYCDGSYAYFDPTKTNCDYVGGSGDCTFDPVRRTTESECAELCEYELDCYYYSFENGFSCILYFMRRCALVGNGGGPTANIYQKVPGSSAKNNPALNQIDYLADDLDHDVTLMEMPNAVFWGLITLLVVNIICLGVYWYNKCKSYKRGYKPVQYDSDVATDV